MIGLSNSISQGLRKRPRRTITNTLEFERFELYFVVHFFFYKWKEVALRSGCGIRRGVNLSALQIFKLKMRRRNIVFWGFFLGSSTELYYSQLKRVLKIREYNSSLNITNFRDL